MGVAASLVVAERCRGGSNQPSHRAISFTSKGRDAMAGYYQKKLSRQEGKWGRGAEAFRSEPERAIYAAKEEYVPSICNAQSTPL